MEHRTLSVPKVSHQSSLSFLLLQVPDPWLRGRQGTQPGVLLQEVGGEEVGLG